MKKFATKVLQAAIFSTLTFALSASAATIVGIDVGANTTYTGAGVLDPTSRAWTVQNNGPFTLDGASVNVACTGFGSGNAGTPTIDLFRSYLHSGGTVTFTGLDNAKLYSFVLYSADNSSQGGTFTLATGSYGGGPAARISTGSQRDTFAEGENYVRFNDVSPASGSIVFTVASDGTGASIFNGFEVAVVPEPGALSALLGGTGVLLGLRRRRAAL